MEAEIRMITLDIQSFTINQANDCGFLLFLLCFFIFVYQVSYRGRMLTGMLSTILLNKDRESLFNEATGSEKIDKILFSFHTLLLLALFSFATITGETPFQTDIGDNFITKILIYLALLTAYILFKLILNFITGSIFFDRESTTIVNDSLISILCLSSPILFFPVLLQFFVPTLYKITTYSVFFVLFFLILLYILRLYLNFFKRSIRLFHFILYLCTLEILPLYLLFREILFF